MSDALLILYVAIALAVSAAGVYAWHRYRRQMIDLLTAILEELRRRGPPA